MIDALYQNTSGIRTLEASRFLETLPDEVGTTLVNGCVQLVEHSDGRLPVNACICDTDTMPEATRALRRDILTASIDV